MRIVLVTKIFYYQSSIPNSHRLLIVLSQLVSPLLWLVSIKYPLEPLSLSPYQKNREPWLGTTIRLFILSLLISSFVRLLDNYLLVMAEIPKIVSFNVVLSIMMQIHVWFVLITKSHLGSTRILWEIHGSINVFKNNLGQKSLITVATMVYLIRLRP